MTALRRLLPLLAALLAASSLAACALSSDGGRTGRFEDPFTGASERPSAETADRTVRDGLKDVERYWTETFPDLADGEQFQAVKGGYFPYTERKPPPACGAQNPGYTPNAFYCPAGDFIAWDAQNLIPRLYSEYGPFLVSIVMAHEYGHAVQERLDLTDQPTIVLEQMADCFAGAWAADVRKGNSDAYDDVKPDQLDSTVAGLLTLRDQPGTPALSDRAHGNAFDRVRAFQDGFEKGSPECVEYRADTLPVTEVPFTSSKDAANNGNLPYDEAVELIGADLQDYWTRTYAELGGKPWQPLRIVPYDDPPTCDGKTVPTDAAAYCASENYVAFEADGIASRLYRQLGDNAVGTFLADAFSRAVQERLGRPAGGTEADCLTGSWTNSVLERDRPESQVSLSPGDLDEAVGALLVLGRTSGSAFDRISAYRSGVLTGLDGCR